MKCISQSPTDLNFVQDPYPFYQTLRDMGQMVWWDDYNMPCVSHYETVNAVLRDRRFGREMPDDLKPVIPARLKPFYDIESHSMLELDPPRHTRLRSLVLRAFTSRRIKELGPDIEAISHGLIDGFRGENVELLEAYAQKIPVIIICRLLGVPEAMADQLLIWSNAMVTMYQAKKTGDDEDAAVKAAKEFAAFMRKYIEIKRKSPADDLITHLIKAEEDGEKLSTDELITTCILLLNAGHEATVHSMGNGIKALLTHGDITRALTRENIDTCVEEIFRYDPPLHIFTRIAREDIGIFGETIKRGQMVACLLASANRDPAAYGDPDVFNPLRPIKANTAFGGGLHFCVGAPLARLELRIALPILFDRCGTITLAHTRYSNKYHFHGLERLDVSLHGS